jgi:hypothetical protein
MINLSYAIIVEVCGGINQMHKRILRGLQAHRYYTDVALHPGVLPSIIIYILPLGGWSEKLILKLNPLSSNKD